MTDIIAASASDTPKPESIFMFHFDVVGGCQLRCVGCPNSTLLPKVKRIEPEVFEHCLGNVDVNHVHTLRLFNFGEPLLHPRFSEILKIVARQRWAAEHVEISTNAQFVYWDDFEAALRTGVLTKLVVSCDGDGSPEEYERLRPPSKWDKLIEFLERTSELRDRHCPQLELATRSIVQTWEDMEAWRGIVEPRGWNAEFRTWKALPEAAENMTGRAIQGARGICTFVAPSERFSHKYYGQLNQLYVDWDGTVVPCCVHPRAGVFGSLQSQTFSDILAGAQRDAFLERMSDQRQDMAICGECEYGPPENPGPSFEDNLPKAPETAAS